MAVNTYTQPQAISNKVKLITSKWRGGYLLVVL